MFPKCDSNSRAPPWIFSLRFTLGKDFCLPEKTRESYATNSVGCIEICTRTPWRRYTWYRNQSPYQLKTNVFICVHEYSSLMWYVVWARVAAARSRWENVIIFNRYCNVTILCGFSRTISQSQVVSNVQMEAWQNLIYHLLRRISSFVVYSWKSSQMYDKDCNEHIASRLPGYVQFFCVVG